MEPLSLTAYRRWLRNFWPMPLGIDGRERLRVSVGAALGILVAAVLSRWWAVHVGLGPWMLAPLGASAVLVIATPSSPMAQPWPVLAGSTLSALLGSACAALVSDVALSGALAVGLSVALMAPLRCLHPPGAAMALFVVLNHSNGVQLAAFPVLFNVLALLAVAVVYNNLTGRSYPHPQREGAATAGAARAGFSSADLDVALAQYNQVLDISRADLEGLLHLAGRAAFERTLGELRCADIMSHPAHAATADTPLAQAWTLMRERHVKALPVVDAQQQVIGIVTQTDFMARMEALQGREGLGQRLRALVTRRTAPPQRVGEIMAQPVRVAQSAQRVMELVGLLSEGGYHHVPIVDRAGRLVGVVTQTDLVRTLARSLQPAD